MNYRFLLFLLFLPLLSCATVEGTDVQSDDLRETGACQRRDLSTVGSRMVINTYDFNLPASDTPSQYSNSKSLPLNIGYLTASCTDRNTSGRFGREYASVLQLMVVDAATGRASAAERYATEWLPYSLPFSAEYADETELTGYDTFYSDDVIVRNVKTSQPVILRVSGRIKGSVSNVSNEALVIHGADCKYAINICGQDMTAVKYYRSEEALFAGESVADPKGATYWSVDTRKGRNFNLAVSFALPSVADGDLAAETVASLETDVARTLKRQKKYWDDFLQNRVPHPSRFDLNHVDMRGVTPDEVKKLYYKAWVALAQNVLKPETGGYPYWQVTAGKSSLWDEGHPTLPFSAAWESFVGLQLFAYIDVDIAWSSLKGLLSLVDERGMLGGESLPSRKAHSAWVLYQLSKDQASLAEVYPAIERYLNWRLTQPRWIYGNATPENEKDAEFVVSVIVDMEYMSKIANELGKSSEAANWLSRREAYIKQYKSWFWETPRSIPVQFRDNYPHRGGFPIQVTTGLVLPELDGDYLESMLNLFYSYYDSDKTFAGFAAPKYPDMDFTVYGLIAKGRVEEAKVMMESFIRDVARTGGVFAETYFDKDGMPDPSGVRPSIFGLAGVIDFVLMRNNYMFTQGTPVALDLYDEETSVDGLKVCGERVGVGKKPGVSACMK